MTKEIVRQAMKKKRLYRNYRATKDPITYNRYKDIESHIKILIRDSVQCFEQKLSNNIKEDSKSFYKYVRSKQQVKDGIGPLKNENGEVSADSNIMAKVLNECFASTFTRESSYGIVNSNIIYDNENKLLCDVNITPEIVIKHIR